jgi:NDP-sugar pyrophosphorylase family protein
MRPLTHSRAKPALPVFGLPMLVRVARELARQGVRFACVNAHHAPESIFAALRENPIPGLELETFVETELMGSGGAYAAPAERLSQSEWFVAQNADTLVAPPVERLIDVAAGGRGRIGALLVRPGRSEGYGAIMIDDGLFAGLETEGAVGEPATYLGAAVFRRDLLSRVPRDRPSELFSDLLAPEIAAGGELAVVPHEGPWIEFTSPGDYLRSLVRIAWSGRQQGGVELPGGSADLAAHAGGVLFAGRRARAELGSRLEGAVILEPGAVAERGAALQDCVLLEDARACSGASLARVVVEAGARAPGCSLRSAVVVEQTGGLHHEPLDA